MLLNTSRRERSNVPGAVLLDLGQLEEARTRQNWGHQTVASAASALYRVVQLSTRTWMLPFVIGQVRKSGSGQGMVAQ